MCNDGEELQDWKHRHVVKTVDFSEDSMFVATGCQNGQVAIYQTSSPNSPPTELKVSTDSSSAPTKLFWRAIASHSITVGKKDGTIQKWDTRQKDQAGPAKSVLKYYRHHSGYGVSLQPEKMIIAYDDKVSILNTGEFEIIRTFDMPKGMSFREEGGVSLRPDQQHFLAGGSDLWLHEFECPTGRCSGHLRGIMDLFDVRYHPDGKVRASGSEDATIRIWDLKMAPKIANLFPEKMCEMSRCDVFYFSKHTFKIN